MTYALMASFGAVYLLEVALQAQEGHFSLSLSSQWLYRLGGNYSQSLPRREYWRLLTACFLHASLLHVSMNSLATYYIAPFLERSFGAAKLLGIFLLTGVLGSLLSSLTHLNDPYLAVGASGGICGLFGALFVVGRRFRQGLPPAFLTWLNQTLGLLIVFSFMPSIDLWGHFGGLGSGFVLGWFLQPRRPQVILGRLDEHETPSTTPSSSEFETVDLEAVDDEGL